MNALVGTGIGGARPDAPSLAQVPVDAGLDAAPDAMSIDAGSKKPVIKRPKRRDAGTSDPDIDFIPSSK